MTDGRKGDEESTYNGKVTEIRIDFQNGENGDRADFVLETPKMQKYMNSGGIIGYKKKKIIKNYLPPQDVTEVRLDVTKRSERKHFVSNENVCNL